MTRMSFNLILVFGVLTAGFAGTTDPLQRIDAYSTQVTPERRPLPGFFPVGILGDHGFQQLPFMGLNLCERSHCCYEFKDGKPCTYRGSGNDRGLYFFNIWAAHTMYHSNQSKEYGTLKRSLDDRGRERGRHHINYFDPATRQYVLDAAAFTVDTVIERGEKDNVFLWGIDNEWEMPLDYSPEALQAFHRFLERVYDGDLDRLNLAWGSTCTTFEDAVPPREEEYSRHPGAWLDWRRFQEEAYAEFLRDYFMAIQERDPLRRGVVSKSTQCTIEMQAVARRRAVNHELLAHATRELSRGWYGFDQYGHGDRNTYEINYLYNCILPDDPNDRRFRSGVFSGELNNHAGPGWQFAQSYWRLPANGYKGGNFFVLGYFGAKNDYSTFGMTSPSGQRRSRFHYLSRFAAAIHRTEAFWAGAVPARVPARIALLMPQRDVMLAGETGVSRWDFSTNNRLSVYNHLRNAGYWVDVIPYGKLNPEFLQRYEALYLVGAEHLSAEECRRIENYVSGGGTLYADMRSGQFDEHHLEHSGLSRVLGLNHKGVYTGIEVSPDDLWYDTEYGNVIRADGKILFETTTAVNRTADALFENAKAAQVTTNAFGNGRAYWFNTRLGTLRPESVEALVVSQFFGQWLADAGLTPGYGHSAAAGDRLRVEIPQVTPDGNLALAITGLTRFAVPAGRLRVKLPGSARFEHAFLACAETALLEKVPFRRTADGAEFELPAIPTAAYLYCFTTPEPLLGIAIREPKESAPLDEFTPRLRAGETCRVKVQLVNPGLETLPAGTLRLRALQDWLIDPVSVNTVALEPGAMFELEFKVTTPEDSPLYKPNFVYPLIAEFEQDGVRRAVIHQSVELLPDESVTAACSPAMLQGGYPDKIEI